MKFYRKKIFPILATPVVIATSGLFVVSCSNANSFNVLEKEDLYGNIWLAALTGSGLANDKQVSPFDMTIEELENVVNQSIKNDETNNFTMKVYCFYLLWNAIKNPYTSSGEVQTNLSTEITEYGTMLQNKMEPDDTDITNDSDKTFDNFKNYIKTFDYKISLVNFDGEIINNQVKIKDVLSSGLYLLNFKIDFWTSDSETNDKMISKNNPNNSIMLKTATTTEQRRIINGVKNETTKDLTKKQYTYQSTKLYYDIPSKQFSTIILPSNVNYLINESTLNSGFNTTDKKRALFSFNWYSNSSNSINFNSFLILRIDSSNNFSTSITSNWTLFLRKNNIINSSGSVDPIKIDLKKSFNIDSKLLEDES